MRLWTVAMLAAVTVSARAQLRLPALPLPVAPLSQTLTPVPAAVPAAVRRAVVARLIGASHGLIEADPNGEPIVRHQILALSPSDAAMERARALGFVVLRQQGQDAAELRVVTLQIPPNLPAKKALRLLRDADPGATYDFNHIYTGAGRDETLAAAGESSSPSPLTPIRIGLLDTGVDSAHPAFRDSIVHEWGCGEKPVPALHGTAVASLLVTHSRAQLYAADVYCGLPTGGAVETILAALAWMENQRVAVINMSLVGPGNLLLERAVAVLVAHGHLIVAAVGNDGPAAPPLYPAAYPHVVGVTGVDPRHHVLFEAGQGPQVMFAAPGSDIGAANLAHGFSNVRGTSFAAPVVAQLLAGLVAVPDANSAQEALVALSKQAIDLGTPGRDSIYGFGLVGAGVAAMVRP